ncbi:putative histidine phosphatase superfamily, clade-1 [Helianthus anomalus]
MSEQQKFLPKRIILVRHRESAGNLDGSAYATTADYKIPLTEAGIQQAKEAGKKIRDVISDSGKWKACFYGRSADPFLERE